MAPPWFFGLCTAKRPWEGLQVCQNVAPGVPWLRHGVGVGVGRVYTKSTVHGAHLFPEPWFPICVYGPRSHGTPQVTKIPTLASLPRLHNSPLAKCCCKKFCMDFHGDHTSTCTSHSGATKEHDWMVSVLGPLFRTAGHLVRTQQGVTAIAGQRRVNVEMRNFLRDQTGSRGPSRIPRTLTARCVLLRSAKPTPIGKHMLTIRTFLFSPLS
jgi:hypothetical protein